ncbi:MAG: hypothetical protein V4497_01815 [Bacteroidota bacterium]
MRQITTDTIPEDILDKIIPENTFLREKVIKKVNEFYQYQPRIFREINKGNYNAIYDIMEYYEKKFNR